MTSLALRKLGVVLLASLVVLALSGEIAAARTRPVLILPFQSATPGETDGWLGEGIAETLFVAAQATPALLPIERARVAQAARATGAETASAERAALALGRSLRA